MGYRWYAAHALQPQFPFGHGLSFTHFQYANLSVTGGKTLLVVEHDMDVVFQLCDRISVLVYGRVIASGSPDEIRANPAVREAYLGSLAQ